MMTVMAMIVSPVMTWWKWYIEARYDVYKDHDNVENSDAC